MDNDKKLQFAIRAADDGTYCVVQIINGQDKVIPQTQHSTQAEAEDWLWIIEELAQKAKKS